MEILKNIAIILYRENSLYAKAPPKGGAYGLFVYPICGKSAFTAG